MSSVFSLNAAQRSSLLRDYRRHPDPEARLRAHILLLLAEGYTWNTIATVLFTSPSTIARWKKQFEVGGVEALRGRQRGAPPRWSAEAEAILRDSLEHSPDELGYMAVNWTVPLLREHVEKQWGQKPSDRELRRQLRQLNYVWKRPRHDLPESKSPRVKRRLRLIRRTVRSLPEDCAVLFEDETDLLLFPPLRAGWFLRGKPATVPISGENAKRVVFGTIEVDTGRRILISREEPCAADFQVLLREIRRRYGKRMVALLLDKASRHTAQGTTRLAAKLNIKFIWLPRRSANINPMDRLWKWGKDKTCANKQHGSIDHQADLFINYLSTLSPEEALRKAGILSGRFWLFR
ncbi:MAG TPA: IS630 family transposase [Gemmataceae bacterium]|nr:IS630 family transposase [Gemmataceae bacterium]